ncbi:sigma-70 family RNA polymerase sigma factor [Kineosporia succinea]|uniref:RNA polymerase sigma factor (Sigma-70 family) n=1 Tax=Kineosporia succinea TaxID=84632 RepID=A0ABT9NVH9_9ACTN|nr:sigma-70 family RNA polymerase sigma factor [Kineosporia succinea]MDP9824424.1 RNA polymerase sigma factor (sigma-70 family) [Kineosporia succinea]
MDGGTVTTDLVLQAQAGDRAALDALVAAHLPLIYNVVGRALNGDGDVDDLVQDTMVGIIRGLPDLREPGRFRSWAVTIAYHRMQDHYRRKYKGMFKRLDAEHDRIPDPSADFAERTCTELALDGQRRELAEAARWLEEADRQLFSLWWQEASGRLTRAELAGSIDATPQHAAVKLQRMRAKLDGSRAVLRALNARPLCPELAELTRGWDRHVDSRWRKRLTRHTRDCTWCRRFSRDLVSPETLLQGVGLVAVPAALLAGLATFAKAGAVSVHATNVSFLGSLAGKSAVIASATAVTLGGITYPLWTGPSEKPTVTPTLVPATSSTVDAPDPTPGASPTPKPTATSYIGVASADLYVAPGGDDSGTGSRTEPFATLARAVSVVTPGQTIALREGVYRPTQTTDIEVSGTSDRRITLSGYRDETPVIDLSGLPGGAWGIVQGGDFWTVQGLEIRDAPAHAYVCESCHDNVFRRLSSHGSGSSGLMLRGEGTARNLVENVDLYGNHDGLGVMFGSGEGNQVRGVRAYRNTVEGIDLGGFTDAVTVRNSWSFGNANGFTLGGGNTTVNSAHVLTDNAAWDNSGVGFNQEGNTGRIRLTRNTAYRNGVTGFWLPTSPAVLVRNLAVRNQDDADVSPGANATGNAWGADASIIGLTDKKTTEGRRREDGSLPTTRFLAPTTTAGARLNGRD